MDVKKYNINCLIPDLPEPHQILPYLEKMHSNRWYSNFGELSRSFELGVSKLVAKQTQDNESELFCCSTSSGTASLEIALSSLGLKPNSNVLVPSLTFPASATSIIRSGLKPLISDVCEKNWQLTPEIAYDVAKNNSISAVLPVATFGTPVDAKGWDRFTKITNIPVIIDAAGAFPFQKIPSHCIVIFSFHATKAFGIGEGGAIFSKSQISNQKFKALSNFGFSEGCIKYLGINGKLSEYHAAVGLAQLKRWPSILKKRQKLYERYNILLTEKSEFLQQQKVVQNAIPSLKVINFKHSSSHLLELLNNKGIEARKWYLPALHQQVLFQKHSQIANLNRNEKVNRYFPNSEKLSKHLIGLPFHNFLSFDDVKSIVESITDEQSFEEIANG